MFPGGARSSEFLLEIIRQILADMQSSSGGSIDSVTKALIDDSTLRTVRADPSTNELTVILHSHHEVHEGDYYFVKGFQDVDGAGSNLDFLFSVPNTTKWPHATWEFGGEAEFAFRLYEGVTTSNNGTPITPRNANRNSTNTATTLAYSSPTLAGGALGDGGQGGTLLRSTIIGSGKTATVSRATGYEFIGKRNTKYWFRITKAAAGTHWVDYDFSWYEHTDKD